MLPKPKFAANLMPTQVSNGLQSSQSWFECSKFEPTNKPSLNESININNNGNNLNCQSLPWYQNNQFCNYNVNNNYSNGHNYTNGFNGYKVNANNHRNDGQNWQKFNKTFNNNNNYNNNYANKKNAFNCDSCCRSFPNEHIYKTHLSEHITCDLDGCKFSAHPKVIATHQRMQHFSFRDKTVVKKFMSLDTPEDITKWREERKANFPTKSNIAKKKAELSEQPTSSFNEKNSNKFNRRQGFGQNKFNRFDKRNRNKRKQFNRDHINSETTKIPQASIESSVPSSFDSTNNDVKRPKLDSKLNDNAMEEGEIVDSDGEFNGKQIQTNNNDIIAANNKIGALNLLSAYDSNDESETDMNEVTTNSLENKDLSVSEPNEKSDSVLENETNADAVNKGPPVISPEIKKSYNQKRDPKKRSTQRRQTFNPRNRKLTLFEKLLKNDIQSKEEQIMDCIKLIVDNNFMQNRV